MASSGEFLGGSLGSRLERLRTSKKHQNINKAQQDPKILISTDWKQVKPFVSMHQEIFISPFDSNSIKEDLSPLFPELLNSTMEDLLFYDLETTGLSGGAGTIAFLAGFGWIEDDRFLINQYFLHDFPGEIDFLTVFKDLLTDGKVLVSYNGKSFDHPLLKTRFLMNGLRMPPMPEIDLLHTSRRLWKKRLPSCRLGTIEESILSIHRVDDVPGFDVPDIYFNYLKTNQTDQLERVFQHHLQDIKSLAVLLVYMEKLWNNPFDSLVCDKTALGRLMLQRDRKSGLVLLKESWIGRDYEAGKFLSLYYKGQGNFAAAVNIWEEMWENRKDLFQGLELAKYYEHKIKDIERALSIVRQLLEKDIFQAYKKGFVQLSHRLWRLERKMEKLNILIT